MRQISIFLNILLIFKKFCICCNIWVTSKSSSSEEGREGEGQTFEMETAHFETKLTLSVLIVVILSKLESEY